MTDLIVAETRRFLARRTTWLVPVGLALLVTVMSALAALLLDTGSAPLSFVADIAFPAQAPVTGRGTRVLGPMPVVLLSAAYSLGAAFHGADRRSGMLETLLTWEPRRVRLLAARSVGGGLVTMASSLIVSTVTVVALYLLTAAVGSTGPMTAALWLRVVGCVVRMAAGAGLFFVLGTAVSVLTDNALAAIGGFVVYALVVESLLGSAGGSAGLWAVLANSSAFVEGTGVATDVFARYDQRYHHGGTVAGLVVLGYVAVTAACAASLFHRRDHHPAP